MTIPAKLKSRKLWTTIVVCGVATVELHMGHLASADWRILVEALAIAFICGQAAQNSLLSRLGPKP
jgi:hypothetical protein